MKIDTDAVVMAPAQTPKGRGFEDHHDKFANPEVASRAPSTGMKFGKVGHGPDVSNSFERGIGTSKL